PDRLDPTVLSGCDSVIHLAARLPANHNDPAEAEACWRSNALGTLRLIDAAIDAGISHFVHTLSANAYRADLQCASENDPMFPVRRATYYLASKIAQELYAANRAAKTSMAVAALRLSSVYGPDQQGGMLPAMIRRLIANERVRLVNGGSFGADFVHVADVARAILLVLGHRAAGPFNVGSGKRVTVREIVDLLLAETGAPHSLVEEVTVAGEDEGFPALDISRMRALGLDPMPLREGLRQMIAAIRDQRNAPDC
ncbi:MAG: NAD(P)-dependent oxidoreductase, partial [Novosphingobium sp.]|nr:NAD(P)-dependent oxidoreductase [Novosphingobium sp.]